ncbi:GHMP family kinase ATP-binding protein [Limnochorda pilosa]|uniref:GHMP kinase n=1 Tax=Limnochorda pilosa TaxID=1555112 RepID=A0A0K2SQC7_LIMPI|nr:hypothetical protein [Limnochorda pilosa]BAS29330.1 GHMP kinase [Limnochorda pilosa]
MEVRWAAASAPGTCGELVQGTLRGEPFLVSCPISWRACARVVLRRERGLCVSGPRGRWKSLRAVRAALRLLGVEDVRAELSLSSPLPVGKGMGSSTAEVLAAAAATAAGGEGGAGRRLSGKGARSRWRGARPSGRSRRLRFPSTAGIASRPPAGTAGPVIASST